MPILKETDSIRQIKQLHKALTENKCNQLEDEDLSKSLNACRLHRATKAGSCPVTDLEELNRWSVSAVQLVFKLDSEYRILSSFIFKKTTKEIENLGNK